MLPKDPRHNTHPWSRFKSVDKNLEKARDQFMSLDESGIAQARANERAQIKELQQASVSPHRRKLLEMDQPPNSIRVAMTTLEMEKKRTEEDEEVTEVRKRQMQTEHMISQRNIAQQKISQRIPKPKAVTIRPMQKMVKLTENQNGQIEEEIKSEESDSSESEFEFDANRYEMRREPNTLQETFKSEFYQNTQINKKEINRKLAELVYFQVEEALSEQFDITVPDIFKDNIQHLASFLVKSKKLQGIFGDFNYQIAQAILYEMNHQREFIKDYLTHPRIPGKDISKKPYMPDYEPKTQLAMTVFKKAKQHIKQVETKYKVTQHQKRKQARKESQEEAKLKQRLQILWQNKTEEKANLLTPIQEVLLERVHALEHRADEIELNNVDLKDELVNAEKDLTDVEATRQGRKPGVALGRLLQQWEENESWYTEKQLKTYVAELWLTKEQFEAELKSEHNSMKQELLRKQAAFVSRVDGIRSQAAFQIKALESALIETKIRAAREVERIEMRLAEMESFNLRKQKGKAFEEYAMRKAAELLAEDDESLKKLTEEQLIKELRQCLKQMMESVESLNMDKSSLVHKRKELEGQIERDRKFNEAAIDENKTAKEMTIFYQMLIHDIISRIKVFDNPKTAKEDRILFDEIFQLNEERLRKNEEDMELYAVPDPKRALSRLGEYSNKMHQLFLQLDFKGIIENYLKIGQEKTKMAQALALELNDIGLISHSHISQKVEPIKMPELVRDTDLSVLDKSKDPSFQRLVPKRKEPLSVYEDLKSYAPIGIIRPERKLAMHTLIEQLLLPQELRLPLIIQQEAELKAEKLKQEKLQQKMDEEQRQLLEKEERKKQKQMTAEKLLEAQHPEIVKKFTAKPVRDKKKLAEQVVTTQNSRKRAIEKKEAEKKLKAKAVLLEQQKQTAIAAIDEQEKEKIRQDLSFPDEETEEYNLNPRVEDVDDGNQSTQLREPSKVSNKKEPISLKTTQSQQKLTQPQQKQTNFKVLPEIKPKVGKEIRQPSNQSTYSQKPTSQSPDTKAKSNVKVSVPITQTIQPASSQDEFGRVTTSRFKHQNTAERINEVQSHIERKIEEKYQPATLISDEEYGEEAAETPKIQGALFDKIYKAFKQSLGQDITSKDYNELFIKTDIDAFLETANKLQAKYLRPLQPTEGKNTEMAEQIPFNDLIVADVSQKGEFQGFKIRQKVAKLWFAQNQSPDQLAKLVKTNNYLNRMIVEQGNEFTLTNKHKVSTNSMESQCDPTPDVSPPERVVVREILSQFQTKPSIPIPQFQFDDPLAEFIDLVRSHCIDVLVRETPQSVSYYKLVWEKQTPQELLKYKLPEVFQQIEREHHSDMSDSEIQQMSVMDYFRTLFEILREKLRSNVPKDELQSLDMTKWLWGGRLKEDVEEKAVQATVQVGTEISQTPKDWKMEEKRGSHLSVGSYKPKSQHEKGRKGSVFSRLSAQSQKKPAIETSDFKDMGVQTGQELIEKFAESRKQNEKATDKLKEQIDLMMEAEIIKTIESMQTYMDQVKFIHPGTALPIPQVEPEPTMDEGLKKRLASLRRNFDIGAKQMQSEFDEVIQKKKKLQSQFKPKDVEPAKSSPKRLHNIALPQIDHLKKATSLDQRFSVESMPQANHTALTGTLTANPFKQFNKSPKSPQQQTMSHFLTGRSSLTPRNPKLRAQVGSAADTFQSTMHDLTPQLQQYKEKNYTTIKSNFFTGKTKAPVKGMITFAGSSDYLTQQEVQIMNNFKPINISGGSQLRNFNGTKTDKDSLYLVDTEQTSVSALEEWHQFKTKRDDKPKSISFVKSPDIQSGTTIERKPHFQV